MKLRHLFTINLFFAAFFGLSCSLFPAWVLRLYSLAPNDAAIWMTRSVGGSTLGFGTLMWFGRRTGSMEARRAIALGLLVQDVIGTIASLEIQIKGNVNALGWSSPILYALLSLGYAYFLFLRPADGLNEVWWPSGVEFEPRIAWFCCLSHKLLNLQLRKHGQKSRFRFSKIRSTL